MQNSFNLEQNVAFPRQVVKRLISFLWDSHACIFFLLPALLAHLQLRCHPFFVRWTKSWLKEQTINKNTLWFVWMRPFLTAFVVVAFPSPLFPSPPLSFSHSLFLCLSVSVTMSTWMSDYHINNIFIKVMFNDSTRSKYYVVWHFDILRICLARPSNNTATSFIFYATLPESSSTMPSPPWNLSTRRSFTVDNVL